MAAAPYDDHDDNLATPTAPKSDPFTSARAESLSLGSEAEENGRGEDQDQGVGQAHDDEDEDEDDEEEDDEEEGDEEDKDEPEDEPKLKYTRLTGHLGAVYRSGDSTSSFMVAGDKMVIGTHNGNINILNIPSFQPLRVYHAHSASVTAISVSPFPPPWPSAQAEALSRTSVAASGPTSSPASSIKSHRTASPRTPRQPQILPTPSNSIYVASASLDGHVCVQSLIDHKDVMLRNFGRPVQALALSPEYKNDRAYLSGGLAGNLILTTGGRSGVSAKANTNSASAAASGWLSSIGIGANSGRDTVLHSGEGSISAIKWSLSGKFVVWVNEQGIKIMRSNINLEGLDADYAWKRIAHIDRPNRARWEEMAGVWKARVEWIDDKNLETDDEETPDINDTQSISTASQSLHKNGSTHKKKKVEKLVVGWGDTAWVLHVTPESTGKGKNIGERIAGSASIVHHLMFDDCIISGLSLYTPSLLLVLAYRTHDDDNKIIPSDLKNTPRRGVHHRQTGLSPELRLINVVTKEEADVDTLTMSRFESLSAGDYHLSTLYVPQAPVVSRAQRGALGALGEGLWDVSFGGAARIFSSSTSILSSGSGENTMVSPSQDSMLKSTITSRRFVDLPPPTATDPGLKIFLQSPYDCVLAVKRDLSDHLAWVLDHERYKEAWELIEEHPEVVTPATTESSATIESPGSTAHSKRRESLADFFADGSGSQTTISARGNQNSAVEKERRRIGELWLQQLVTAQDWKTAGQVAGRVLGLSSQWQHWILTFANADKFDEITPYVPTKPLQPQIDTMAYEVILGHYIVRDRVRLKQLLNAWDTNLFKINVITTAIEEKLSRGDISENTVEGGEQGRDWRIFMESLAKLYLADGRAQEALRCYIRLQDADAAMNLIREHHLLSAISDDLSGFLLLRISKEQLQSASLDELEDASSEAVHLLVDEAYRGTVPSKAVVDQLKDKGPSLQPFLFFYFRSLWKGLGTEAEAGNSKKKQQIEAEGRQLVEEEGDLAVLLFAEYDRPLLMQFIRASRSYAFEQAAAICEAKHFWPELVYLLSQTGETKRALSLIINRLGDVSLAISFAKEQDDKDLWNDLLDYSMDKPGFIRGLLEEVGTSINPITLVRRIPEGLEIEGLREGIGKMVREYEIQESISEGVAKVLRSEVAGTMDALRKGRAKAVKFDVVHKQPPKVEISVQSVQTTNAAPTALAALKMDKRTPAEYVQPGHCAGCRDVFVEEATEKGTLIGFACGHIYHLSCLLDAINDPNTAAAAERLQRQLATDAADDSGAYSRSVGVKVAHAHIIRNAIKGGCLLCRGRESG